ncbi:hypothetical protein [Cyprinid herpesvirus 3]|uniref:Uncharacterized protein n=1 Tax=Cyprinid herpesvirus 3 TaxID=180230 RepID=A3QMH3_CYHV3|nr:hypothetical protein [Cyprinid herpesvirus 3]ABC55250.1 hypothetical protein [Cyprinid herpesvirus 3]
MLVKAYCDFMRRLDDALWVSGLKESDVGHVRHYKDKKILSKMTKVKQCALSKKYHECERAVGDVFVTVFKGLTLVIFVCMLVFFNYCAASERRVASKGPVVRCSDGVQKLMGEYPEHRTADFCPLDADCAWYKGPHAGVIPIYHPLALYYNDSDEVRCFPGFTLLPVEAPAYIPKTLDAYPELCQMMAAHAGMCEMDCPRARITSLNRRSLQLTFSNKNGFEMKTLVPSWAHDYAHDVVLPNFDYAMVLVHRAYLSL